jgi:hypothetical protein
MKGKINMETINDEKRINMTAINDELINIIDLMIKALKLERQKLDRMENLLNSLCEIIGDKEIIGGKK